MMVVRVYLTGHVALEGNDKLLNVQDVLGPQGRLLLARLVLDAGHPIECGQLVDMLWPKKAPRSWRVSLSALVSKIRGCLDEIGVDGSQALTSAFACYQLRLPPVTWVDVSAAVDALHEAETAVRDGEPLRGYKPARIALYVTNRPFLPGSNGTWVAAWRDRLHTTRVRALECSAETSLANEEHVMAIEHARAAIALESFRESAHRLLIRAHAAAGNRAEALWAYETCRGLLAEELGVDPAEQTKAVYLQVLRA